MLTTLRNFRRRGGNASPTSDKSIGVPGLSPAVTNICHKKAYVKFLKVPDATDAERHFRPTICNKIVSIEDRKTMAKLNKTLTA